MNPNLHLDQYKGLVSSYPAAAILAKSYLQNKMMLLLTAAG